LHLLAAAVSHAGVDLEEVVHLLGVLLAVEALVADEAVLEENLELSLRFFLLVRNAPATGDSDQFSVMAQYHLDSEKCAARPLGQVGDRLVLGLGPAQLVFVLPVLSDHVQRVHSELVDIDAEVVCDSSLVHLIVFNLLIIK